MTSAIECDVCRLPDPYRGDGSDERYDDEGPS